jgi:putative peptidoglycan lipid II flippase
MVAADAYAAAIKIPNVLRNLLGEGSLSAAFVPVYSSLLKGDRAESEAPALLARRVLGRLVLLAGVLSALGVALAPWLTRIVAPGFDAEASALTTQLVRILFPMAGVMILAAWCLGVLTSHRRFFLPFAAPVLWNLAQVAGLLLGARFGWSPLIRVLAWSTLAGSLLQLGVQLPTARRLARGVRPLLDRGSEPVRRVMRNMVPVAASQGIFQLASFADVILASFLPAGAVVGLYYAQRLAYLPLSLFGVSVAAAALPEMSRQTGPEALRSRLVNGFFQILYFVLPAAIALAVRIVFQRGAFDEYSTQLVSGILIAYAVGLVATSSVKLFAGGFHAMQDTRTPMRFAAISVASGIALGASAMLLMRGAGYGALSAAGLALGGSLGAWLNLLLLWSGLHRRVGVLFENAALRPLVRLCVAALAGAAAGSVARLALTARIHSETTIGAAAVLTGTLLAAGVVYLSIVRRPPRPISNG